MFRILGNDCELLVRNIYQPSAFDLRFCLDVYVSTGLSLEKMENLYAV